MLIRPTTAWPTLAAGAGASSRTNAFHQTVLGDGSLESPEHVARRSQQRRDNGASGLDLKAVQKVGLGCVVGPDSNYFGIGSILAVRLEIPDAGR